MKMTQFTGKGSNRIEFRSLKVCHISPDSVNDAERTEKLQKNVYPVVKVVSVAMKFVAECVRSAQNA